MQEFPGGLAVKASASLLLWLQYCCGSGSIPGLGTSTRHRHSSPHSPKRRRSRHAVLTLSFCHPFPLPVSWAGCQPPGHMGAMYEQGRSLHRPGSLRDLTEQFPPFAAQHRNMSILDSVMHLRFWIYLLSMKHHLNLK